MNSTKPFAEPDKAYLLIREMKKNTNFGLIATKSHLQSLTGIYFIVVLSERHSGKLLGRHLLSNPTYQELEVFSLSVGWAPETNDPWGPSINYVVCFGGT